MWQLFGFSWRFLGVLGLCFVLSASGGPAIAAELTPETEALFQAVRTGKMGAVKRAILAGGDVDGENISGLTPAEVAIDNGNFKIAHYILFWRRNQQGKQRPRVAFAPQPAPQPEASPEPEPQPAPAPRPVVAVEPAPPPARPPVVMERAAPPAPAPAPAPMPAPEPVHEPAPQPLPEPPQTASVPTPQNEPAPPVAPIALEENNTPAKSEAKPGMIERVSDFFSFKPEDTQPTPEPQQAVAPEPEPTPEPAPIEVTVAKTEPESSAEALSADSEAGPNMLDRVSDFFSLKSKVAKATAEAEPEPAPVEAPVEAPVAEAEPVSIPEAPPVESDTGPNMLDRVNDFFSFKSEVAKAAPEPEPEPAPVEAAVEAPVVEAVPASIPEAPPVESGTAPNMLDRVSDLLSFRSENAKAAIKPPAEPEQTAAMKPKPAPVLMPVPETQPIAPQYAPRPTPRPAATIQTAQAAPPAAFARVVAAPQRRIDPVLGRSLRLGKSKAGERADVCIDKGSVHLLFCIEPVDWPEKIADAFQVRSSIYTGAQAIVHYDSGRASQIHTLFPARHFEAIAAYLAESLGASGAQSDSWAIMPGEANRPNRIVRWRGPGTSILEIRQVDDLRWSSVPDTKHGVVRIYAEGAAPLFRYVSWSDFTLARISK
ncbi:MAG: ankyrin repeat domain-containing protein [Alphaproteobacteria bacterium]|nr:ankyrin repeat domain-containing protein [Alphaproteobacteria bacterium]